MYRRDCLYVKRVHHSIFHVSLYIYPFHSCRYQGKQVSRSLQLSSGQPYLLRVHMKAGSGIQTGHVSVGVQTPSGVLERPLSNGTLEQCE